MSDNIPRMTQAAYARYRGVTPKAIDKAIESGRIPSVAVRRDGRSKFIDVAAADLALGASCQRIGTPTCDPLLEKIGGSSSPALDDKCAEVEPQSAGLTRARTQQAEIAARIQSLELAKRTGEVLLTADATRSMALCAEALVRDVDQLPTFTDEIVTALHRNGAAGVRTVLKDISRRVRNTIAENMRLLASSDVDEGSDIDALH